MILQVRQLSNGYWRYRIVTDDVSVVVSRGGALHATREDAVERGREAMRARADEIHKDADKWEDA